MSSEDGYPLTITEAATEPSLTSKEGEEVPEITVAELAEMESGELASSDEEISIAKEHQLPPSSNDENLWMFGDLLTRLSDSLMDPSAVEQLLAKIIDVCFKMVHLMHRNDDYSIDN
jgi:hypothetical protein